MTQKEIVLGGYQSFSTGDLESLGKIFHENAVIRVNGNHKRSGEYKGLSFLLFHTGHRPDNGGG